MKKIVFLSLVFLSIQLLSQTNTWDWDINNKTARIYDQYTDAAGNTYVTGSFGGTVTLGGTTLTDAGQYDAYIAKYDLSGNLLWARRGGGTSPEEALSVTGDGLGNVYITGYMQSTTAVFGTYTLTCSGTMDVFVCKYDPNGNVLWAQRFGGSYSHYDKGYAIIADAVGNTYTTGSFYGNLSATGIPYIQNCGNSISAFLLKLDPNGNGLWSKRTTCTPNNTADYSYGSKLAFDGQGNVIMGSVFNSDSCFYEGIKLHNASTGATDGVIAKYTPNGTFRWLRHVNSYLYNAVYGITCDSKGNSFVTGEYQGNLTFPTFSLSASGSAGTYYTYVMKIDSTGMPIWGNRIGNSPYQHPATDIMADADSVIYVSGYFQDHLWFDNTIILPNQGSSMAYGMYYAKYSAATGTVTSVFDSRDMYGRIIQSLSMDGYHNLYVGGSFNNTLTLGATPAITSGTTAANFLARYGDITTGITEATSTTSRAYIYPNPNNGNFSIQLYDNSQVTITNVLGDMQFDGTVKAGIETIKLETKAGGIYFVKIRDSKGQTFIRKMIVEE